MTEKPKRKITDEDRAAIQDLWARREALRRLAKHSLPAGTPGAWVAEAAVKQIEHIDGQLELLFDETAP